MKVFIALFLLFLIEGTWAAIFSWHYATPYVLLTLIGLMYVGLYGRWESALGFGLVFGLLYDIVFTDLIGIYAFTFSLISSLSQLRVKIYRGECLLRPHHVHVYDSRVHRLDFCDFDGDWWDDDDDQTLLMQQIPGTLAVNAVAIGLLYYPMVRYVAPRPVAKRG